jgi:hypothetical protein
LCNSGDGKSAATAIFSDAKSMNMKHI